MMLMPSLHILKLFLICEILSTTISTQTVLEGKDALPGQFKSIVYYLAPIIDVASNDETTDLSAACTGTIVSGNWVLTAAHCFASYLHMHTFHPHHPAVVDYKITISAGTIDLSTDSSFQQTREVNSQNFHFHPESYPLNFIDLHDDNDPDQVAEHEFAGQNKTIIQIVDLVLINIIEGFIFDVFVSSVPLLRYNGQVLGTITGISIGFGQIELMDTTNTKLRYNDRIIAGMMDFCLKHLAFDEDDDIGKPQFVCARDEEERNICFGDSGGPLMFITSENRLILAGVLTSMVDPDQAEPEYGYFCSDSVLYGVYTLPGRFESWITTTADDVELVTYDGVTRQDRRYRQVKGGPKSGQEMLTFNVSLETFLLFFLILNINKL